MNDSGAKQQIVEKVKGSSNILITVSRNPSVDELSAALGLTLLLNKMNKHATAVFSGEVPPAITFLEPAKTFENTVDSLRDFIIALDKEKADHLRYKVDGEVVKIFITPYRTTISSDDLEFSQGDYNVELVLALGVKDRDDLDGALSAHGRILHDATVATLSIQGENGELGSIDWHEDNASSYSEMLVSMTDALKKDKALLDEQIATAFLTGIVAATDRFSNDLTSSRAMTIAAQLMSAGANQQLIASKLEEAHEINQDPPAQSGDSGEQNPNSDGTTDLSEGELSRVDRSNKPMPKQPEPPKKKKDDGALTISHEKEGTLEEVSAETESDNLEAAASEAQNRLTQQIGAAPQEDLARKLAEVAPQASAPIAGAASPSVADMQKDLAAASQEVSQDSQKAPGVVSKSVLPTQWDDEQAPSMGGVLNATTEQAAEDKRRAIAEDRNRKILTHSNSNSYVGNSKPTYDSPINAAGDQGDEPQFIDPFKDMQQASGVNGGNESTETAGGQGAPTAQAAPVEPVQPPAPQAPTSAQTLEDLERESRANHDQARNAVDAAFGAVPFTPSNNPAQNVGAQQLGGPVQHDQPSMPPMPGAPAAPALPPMPPMPDFSTLPPLPGTPPPQAAPAPMDQPMQQQPQPPEKLEDMFGPPPAGAAPQPPMSGAPAPQTPPQPADPKQFKIPGQS